MEEIGLINERKTIQLFFFLDYRSGKVHTDIEDGGLLYGENEPEEVQMISYATFFYEVLGNGIAELTTCDLEPIDCEIVIPVNIPPPNPEEALKRPYKDSETSAWLPMNLRALACSVGGLTFFLSNSNV